MTIGSIPRPYSRTDDQPSTVGRREDHQDFDASSAPLFSRHRHSAHRLVAGQDLFRLGEPCDAVYNLVDGWLFRYSLLPDGRRQILDFTLPGSVLGFYSAHGQLMTYGAQALTDAVVYAIPRKELESLSRRQPDFGLRLAWLISREQSLTFAHLSSIGRQSAHERVAQLILELFVRSHLRWPGHRIEEMRLPLTQEHIGEAVGLSGVHVNRILANLRKDGILQFSYKRLRILDPDRLLDISTIDPEVLKSWIHDDPVLQGDGASTLSPAGYAA